MRRWVRVLAIVTGALLALGGVAAATGTYLGYPEANVEVGGVTIHSDVPAIIINGRTLVPLRFVAQALGAAVGWDQNTRTATVQPDLIELVTAQSVDEPTSSTSSTTVGTAAAGGGPVNTANSFSLQRNAIYAYALLWDDGTSHTYTFRWTDASGRVLKNDPVQMENLVNGSVQAPTTGPGLGWHLTQHLTGMPAQVAVEDPFALEMPFTLNQSRLPDAGLYFVTLYRDGTPVAKAAFTLTR